MKSTSSQAFFLVACLLGTAACLLAQDPPKVAGYTDTPMLPGTPWHVHDPNRPQPKLVTPGALGTVAAPSDAVVLFDGKDLSKWQSDSGKPSSWVLENGAMRVPPRGTPNGGDIVSKDSFGDMQLHIEWRTPDIAKGTGQERGNSGILIMERYELQVLDCFNNPTYPDGQAGAVYGQTPPQVNASFGPGQWQAYDVIWTAPRFKDGQLETPAYITVLHNGVLVQNHTKVIGSTVHRQLAKYSPHDATAPLRLQDHGDGVSYRNIWVRPLVTVP
jgi:hypothetical protein